MARTYVVKRGDTLARIAKAQLGDAALFMRIAELNGMRDPNHLAPGQRLEIPLRRELAAPTPAGVVAAFKRSGFTWGGDWSGAGKDPMHFQYCTGY
jgi:hypothetical protein